MTPLDQEQQRLKTEMDERKARWPFPGGWRADTQPTHQEKKAEEALLERQRRKQEQGKPFTVLIGGVEYGRRRYLHIIAGEFQRTAWNNIEMDDLKEFLHAHKGVHRRRIRWGVYYNIDQFTKEWRKRLTRLSQTRSHRKIALTANAT